MTRCYTRCYDCDAPTTRAIDDDDHDRCLRCHLHYWGSRELAGDPVRPPPIKQCACGSEYTAVTWYRLLPRGTWRLPWGEVQELRDCACGSTISLVLETGVAQ